MEKQPIYIGVAVQGFIPVRKDPYERSEMVTQVLFGESAAITDEEGRWLYIRTLNDSYEGWIDKKCIEKTETTAATIYIVAHENTKVRNLSNGQKFTIPIGAAIPAVNKGEFSLASYTYRIENPENIVKPGSVSLADVIDDVISVPYLWGGRCGFGFDCSGLTQYLCRVTGKEIPRDAGDQSAAGTTLSFISEARTGDLAFFDDEVGVIHHVGMMIGNDRIIHASGLVKTDRIDQQGIFNEKLGGYTHKLRVIKRLGK